MAHTVTDNTARHRYEMPVEGSVAIIDYHDVGGKRVMTHTEVPVALRGRNLGAQIAKGAFDLARQDGLKLDLRCWFLVDFVKLHPDYADLVA